MKVSTTLAAAVICVMDKSISRGTNAEYHKCVFRGEPAKHACMARGRIDNRVCAKDGTLRYGLTVFLSCGILVAVLLLGCATKLFAQAPQNSRVPMLVNFSGALTDVAGKPLAGLVGVTFYLYKDQQGGSPLWMETQNVQPDRNGRYRVVLGSTSSQGLPTDLFASGEPRWLAVQVQGQDEQPRTSLLSVPYALKAADAETLGGLPASAFMPAATSSGSRGEPSTARQTGIKGTQAQVQPATTSEGPADFTGATSAPTPIVAITQDGTGPALSAVSPKNDGIVGKTGATTGANAGVYGLATASTGAAVGVEGISANSPTGTGVKGIAASSAGGSGVYGQSTSSAGIGGRFQNTSTATGAKILVAEDSSGTQRFSVDTHGNVNVVTGTTTQVKGPLLPVNHARTTVTTSSGNNDNLFTLDWAFAFPDTSYTATCSYVSGVPFESGGGVWGFEINSLSASSLQVDVAAYGSTSIEIHCIGVHD